MWCASLSRIPEGPRRGRGAAHGGQDAKSLWIRASVGAVEPEPIDVRIVAATNKDLEALLATGAFRQDLYYRLNVVKLDIPPLRERLDDIPLVVENLLRRLEKETGVPVAGVDGDAEAVLRAYAWPGNVRELRNTLEQALYVKAEHVIRKRDLPRAIVAAVEGGGAAEDGRTLKVQLRRTEEELLRRALLEAKGDKLAAAARLGISKSSLYAKIEQYGLGDDASPRVR